MNTSAPDLLTEPTATFTGTLLCHAQVRMRQLDNEGHMVPTLCLDLVLDSAMHNRLRVEKRFAPDQQEVALAIAKDYRQGTRIDVDALVADLRMFAANATRIHVHPAQEQPA